MSKVKCSDCGDVFFVDEVNEWTEFCFHCGKGRLREVEDDGRR